MSTLRLAYNCLLLYRIYKKNDINKADENVSVRLEKVNRFNCVHPIPNDHVCAIAERKGSRCFIVFPNEHMGFVS